MNQKIHTKELRKDLLNAVNSRFESLVDSDLFKIATFLDCNFGLSAFEKDQQLEIRRLIKSTLLWTKSKITSVETIGGAK